MAENSTIEWTRHTWSPWIGCTKLSPACDGCYAEHLMDTRLGRVVWGPHGERVRTGVDYWRQPMRWNREAHAAGRFDLVFPSLCDPFDNQADPVIRREWFGLMQETPHLTWLLLTKRPQNIVRMVQAVGFMPANIALGATCEDQRRLEQNAPALLGAAHELEPLYTFLSCEPLLGPLNLRRIRVSDGIYLDALTGAFEAEAAVPGGLANVQAALDVLPPLPARRTAIGQVIDGGETSQGKHKARPTHPDWFRGVRDQCAAAFTPYLHKQNGDWLEVERDNRGDYISSDPRIDAIHSDNPVFMAPIGKRAAGRLLDGVVHDGMPEVRGA